MQPQIYIEKYLLSKAQELLKVQDYSAIFIFADRNVSSECTLLTKNLENKGAKVHSLLLEGRESLKSLPQAEILYNFLINRACDRRSLIIALGGGTIGDLAGFVAATFLRGLDYINIPTTLLSQVDSSIGGKTGVNFNGYKNIIGTFHQPKTILIDPELLQSLPPRQFASGMGEVIKYALIFDKDLYLLLQQNTLSRSSPLVEKIIARCVHLKTQIVATDEKDTGRRAVLNFGHTIAHAIEATSNQYTHGEAVGIGLLGALLLSINQGVLKKNILPTVKKLLSTYNLPAKILNINGEKLYLAMLKDKKVINGNINWVLLEDIGKPVLNQPVDKEIVLSVLNKLTL